MDRGISIPFNNKGGGKEVSVEAMYSMLKLKMFPIMLRIKQV